MDGWQVLYSFIGSFLGFGFALIAEGLFVMAKNNKNINKTMRNLNDELRYIHDAFYDKESGEIISDRVFVGAPIWDSIVSTGDILELLKKHEEYYNSVISIYSKIQIIEKMESEIDKTKYAEFIEKDKKQVVENIKELLQINGGLKDVSIS